MGLRGKKIGLRKNKVNSFDADAMSMARDAISGKALEYEEEGKRLPEPSDYEKARTLTVQRADGDDFLYSKGICTLVDTDLEEYRRKMENRSVKKNCTIPQRCLRYRQDLVRSYAAVIGQREKRKRLNTGRDRTLVWISRWTVKMYRSAWQARTASMRMEIS